MIKLNKNNTLKSIIDKKKKDKKKAKNPKGLVRKAKVYRPPFLNYYFKQLS